MPDLSAALRERLQPAFDAIEPGADPVVRASDRADYQANGVMAIAKRLGRPPRELAEAVRAAADLEGIATIDVAGPGFLNLTFDNGFLARSVDALRGDARLGVPCAKRSPHPVRRDTLDAGCPALPWLGNRSVPFEDP